VFFKTKQNNSVLSLLHTRKAKKERQKRIRVVRVRAAAQKKSEKGGGQGWVLGVKK
jgi:hypothetical protein